MSPALAARIERAVGASGRFAFAFRVGIAVAAVVIAWQIIAARVRSKNDLERARAELLEAARVRTGALTPEEAGFMMRVEPWLEALSRAYEGDLVAEELRPPNALDAALARPSVYVRGPIAAFGSPAAVTEATAASTKDALVTCLLDPPASRSEKAVVGKVRAAYSSSAQADERTAQARALREVDAGVRELLQPWGDRARAAEDQEQIARIKKELAKLHVDETKRAARAELLIAAMDEPAEGGPTELDGERPHAIRVGLVDLRAARVVVRMRRRVDPSWVSPETRVMYASAVDACAFAYDVRQAAVR
jgi:hypothetical protein